MITLTDITPVADWDIACDDTDYCDGYGCEIHASYQGGMCGVVDCVSPVSSYRVIVEGVEMDMCHFHYNSQRVYLTYPQILGTSLCGTHHTRHAVFGLDFWGFICQYSTITIKQCLGNTP